MKCMVFFAIALALLFGCTGYGAQGNQGQGTGVPSGGTGGATGGEAASVQIISFAFVPAEITIKAGSSVTWTNKDSPPHSVVGDGWASDTLPPGGTYTKKFDKAGEYPYHCSIHPSMTGKVIVQ